jgi:hypothetical protein
MDEDVESDSLVDGVVVESSNRDVRVQLVDGNVVEAFVPLRCFSTKGGFDMCQNVPIGIRVTISLRKSPKRNRVLKVLDWHG